MSRSKRTPASNISELTGQRFGKLVVLELSETKKGKSWWKCICDCGQFCYRMAATLQRGFNSNCGCLKTGPRKDPREMGLNQLIQTYKENARQRGHEYSLSKEKFNELISNNCHYCGISPSKKFSARYGWADITYNGIDRMNNEIGYIEENCVTCCTDCNYLKNKRNYKEFLDKIKLIARKHNV